MNLYKKILIKKLYEAQDIRIQPLGDEDASSSPVLIPDRQWPFNWNPFDTLSWQHGNYSQFHYGLLSMYPPNALSNNKAWQNWFLDRLIIDSEFPAWFTERFLEAFLDNPNIQDILFRLMVSYLRANDGKLPPWINITTYDYGDLINNGYISFEELNDTWRVFDPPILNPGDPNFNGDNEFTDG